MQRDLHLKSSGASHSRGKHRRNLEALSDETQAPLLRVSAGRRMGQHPNFVSGTRLEYAHYFPIATRYLIRLRFIRDNGQNLSVQKFILYLQGDTTVEIEAERCDVEDEKLIFSVHGKTVHTIDRGTVMMIDDGQQI